MLALEHGALAPSLHFDAPNEHFDFAASPFRVVTHAQPWPRRADRPRRAAISSFGLSGTNAHVIVDEYRGRARGAASHASGAAHASGVPDASNVSGVRDALPASNAANAPRRPEVPEAPETPSARHPATDALVVLSARDAERLRDYARRLLRHVSDTSPVSLPDLAYTLQTGRAAMPHRLAIAADAVDTLRDALSAFVDGRPHPALVAGAAQGGAGTGAAREALTHAHAWDALARAWVAGAEIDWPAAHGAALAERVRVNAPTYPFARERYWLPRPPADEAGARRRVALVRDWTSAPLGAPAVSGARPVATRILMVGRCAANRALADALAPMLPDAALIDVCDDASFDRLPAAAGVVDLTGCAREPIDEMRWLALVQRVVASRPRALYAVTAGLETPARGAAGLAGAWQAGLYLALAAEYPSVASRVVDLPEGGEPSALAALVAAEYDGASADVHCRYRDGVRERAIVRPLDIDADVDAPGRAPRASVLGPDDCVWITGGTRGLGLTCARHLVSRHGVRRLLLTGRTALPPRSEWDALGARDADFARRAAGLRALEAMGARIEYSAVALDDARAVAAELARVRPTLGAVTALVHCAGAVDWSEPAFFAKSRESMRAVLQPKTAGLATVVDALAGAPVKRIVLFSSVAAAIPALGAGQADYATANAWLDYFARAYARALPVVSVQWPNWRGAGMGEVRSRAYAQSGLSALDDAQGLALFDWALERMPAPVVLPAFVRDGERPWLDWLGARTAHRAAFDAESDAGPALSLIHI